MSGYLEAVRHELAEPDRHVAVASDVTDPNQVDAGVAAACDGLGGLDGLVHSAGLDHVAGFADTSLADWRAVLDTNLTSVFHLCRAAYPDLAPYDVYMSGPPAMIDAAKPAFLANGLPENRLYYDSFEFGADVPVRILAQPH